MKLFKLGILLAAALSIGACSRVGNGEVGVRYHTIGSDRGVEDAALGMGYYLTGPGTGIETFPTFAQTRTWTEQNGEAIRFSDSGGLAITAEMGITYQVDPSKAPYLYKRYRRGVDEITDTFIHNMVRDTLIEEAAKMPIEQIYGPGKSRLLQAVQTDIMGKVNPQGILIQNVYWIGQLDLPESVKQSINNKIVATQRAQQIENEVAQTQAEAQKNVAEAEGKAKSRLAYAEAEAKANEEIAKSISPTLVEYMKVQKWDGHTPRVTTGGGTILSLSDK